MSDVQIEFRNFSRDGSTVPDSGELFLLPRDPQQRDCRQMALYVLENGVESLLGEGRTPKRIVLPTSPTLDDMLAAEIALRRFAVTPDAKAEPGDSSAETPADSRSFENSTLQAFARYTGLVRSGHRPTLFPLENTIEGVFLAICASAADLTEHEERYRRLLAGWRPLADLIFSAAGRNADPFHTDLVSERSEFAEARCYLRADREVYRHDVINGDVWSILISSDNVRGHALVLKNPRSILFKYWCREDERAAGGNGYLLLIVRGADAGSWTISTDTARRLSLRSLAEQLQQVESGMNGDTAGQWFDGKPFGYSLIASPHGGSRLPDIRVLEIVRQWCQGKKENQQQPLPGALRRGKPLAFGAATAVVLIGGLWISGKLGWLTSYNSRNGQQPNELDRGGDDEQIDSPDRIQVEIVNRKARKKDRALVIATDEYDHWPNLTNPVLDGTAITSILRENYGFDVTQLDNPDRNEVLTALRSFHDQSFASDAQLLIYIAGHGDLINKEGHLVFHDSKGAERDPNRTTCLAHSLLRDIVEKVECRHVLVVLDVCFGSSFDFAEATRSGPPASSTYGTISREIFARRKLQSPGRIWLTSGGIEPVSDGVRGRHSPFADQFIRALSNGDGDDRILTFGELWSWVDKIERSEPRTGYLRGHENGDFLFIRSEADATTTEEMQGN